MAQIDHTRIGFNYRMTEMQAAIGIGQLERLEQMLAARASVADAYTEGLSELGGAPAGEGDPGALVLPSRDAGRARRSWFVYVVRLPTGTDRAALIEQLASQGIQSKAYLPCIHTMPPYRERFGFRGGEFPIAEAVAQRSLALPFFGSLSESQIERVCESLSAAIAAR